VSQARGTCTHPRGASQYHRRQFHHCNEVFFSSRFFLHPPTPSHQTISLVANQANSSHRHKINPVTNSAETHHHFRQASAPVAKPEPTAATGAASTALCAIERGARCAMG
jgi:hypothetical protein